MTGQHSHSRGFTLIEVIVVTGITVMITLALVANFSRSSSDLLQNANKFVADIRDAQTRAVAGARLAGKTRCGYGVHYVDESTYVLYAGPDATDPLINCSALDRNYNAGEDTIILSKSLSGTSTVLAQNFPDIFFEPPNPTTYINNSASAASSQAITLVKRGGQCPKDCKVINVYGTGRIEAK